jgi:hypothetical protein
MDGHTRLTLLLARVLISGPDCWTTDVLARDRTGCPVSPLDDSAVSWCARGAVYRVVGGDIGAFQSAIRVLEESSQALYGASICAVNDGPPAFAHASVLGAFDHAVDAPRLARHAYELATCPPEKSVDVLQILGLTSRSSRQAVGIDLTGIDPTRDDASIPTENQRVTTIPART